MPAPIEYLRFLGIELATDSLTLVMLNAMNTRPSTKTAARAICQGSTPVTCFLERIPAMKGTTVKAKYPFSPMPGARANGIFAYSAIMSVARPALAAVATTNASLGIPVAESIAGFTKSM